MQKITIGIKHPIVKQLYNHLIISNIIKVNKMPTIIPFLRLAHVK